MPQFVFHFPPPREQGLVDQHRENAWLRDQLQGLQQELDQRAAQDAERAAEEEADWARRKAREEAERADWARREAEDRRGWMHQTSELVNKLQARLREAEQRAAEAEQKVGAEEAWLP